jgi:hypothetical protein
MSTSKQKIIATTPLDVGGRETREVVDSTIKRRFASRSFTSRPVPRQMVADILDVARSEKGRDIASSVEGARRSTGPPLVGISVLRIAAAGTVRFAPRSVRATVLWISGHPAVGYGGSRAPDVEELRLFRCAGWFDHCHRQTSSGGKLARSRDVYPERIDRGGSAGLADLPAGNFLEVSRASQDSAADTARGDGRLRNVDRFR